MIRGATRFDHREYQGCQERHAKSDRPGDEFNGGNHGQHREDGRPQQFERTGHAEDVAEQEEVQNHKADRDADPEVDERDANGCRGSDGEDAAIEHGEAEARRERRIIHWARGLT